MNPAMVKAPILKTQPDPKAGIAAVFYALTVLTGVVVLFAGDRFGFVADVAATGFYLAVMVCFYGLTRKA